MKASGATVRISYDLHTAYKISQKRPFSCLDGYKRFEPIDSVLACSILSVALISSIDSARAMLT